MSVSVILARKGREVVTIAPSATMDDAARLLADRHIGAIVVVDDAGGIAGMLSERDIVRALSLRGAAMLGEPVSAYMTKKVETATPADTIDNLMARMTAGKFRHIPVCEGRTLAGIVSIGDVVKLRLADIEAEASAMRDYIAMA